MDLRNWNPPARLQPALQHYILSFDQLFRDSNLASNGLSPQLALPHRSQRGLQAARPGLSQAATANNIQEVWYQEGSKDLITHTESSGFHFIEIHQGTVRAMLTFLIILGALLCCQQMARNHHLQRRGFRDVMKKVEEHVARFTAG